MTANCPAVDDKLVERLRALAERQKDQRGDMLYRGSADPEIIEAADRIEALNRELAEARSKALEEAAKVADDWPEYTDEPFVLPASAQIDEDDFWTPEIRGSCRRFAKPHDIAEAIRALIDSKAGGMG